MWLFLPVVLSTQAWTVIFTGVGTSITVFAFVWNFNRGRKKEFQEAMEKKADAAVVKSDFETRDEMINTIRIKVKGLEKNTDSQFSGIKDQLEEIRTGQEYANSRSDEIMKLLIKMK